MSPVNRAGPVTKISFHFYFLCKNCDVFMRRRDSPVTEISLSTTEMKIFPHEHSSLVPGTKMFLTN